MPTAVRVCAHEPGPAVTMAKLGEGTAHSEGPRVSTAITAPRSISRDVRAVSAGPGSPPLGRRPGSQPGVRPKALLAERGGVAGSVPRGAQPGPPRGSAVLCDGCSQLGPARPSTPSSRGVRADNGGAPVGKVREAPLAIPSAAPRASKGSRPGRPALPADPGHTDASRTWQRESGAVRPAARCMSPGGGPGGRPGGRRLLPRGSLSAWAGGRATTEPISTVRGPGLSPSPVGSPLSLLKPLLHN